MTPENVIRTCEECGREIPRKRIEAAPNATLCVACQEAADVVIKAGDRRLMNALVERAEYDGEMFAPEAHE
jgi:RNA polymerase-binding transcription factor DksA